MSLMMVEDVLPLERVDPELAGYFKDIVDKKLPIIVYDTEIYFRRADGKLAHIVFPVEVPGRNDICPYCNSGKKYKKCCGRE